jgi:AhpD family alkylhydroperoxidase
MAHTKSKENRLMYDMKNLGKLKNLNENAQNAFEAFFAFDKIAMGPGTVPTKYKELVAVALTTQCPYCIELHAGRARHAGAGDAELAEITAVAAAIRAGGAITHATHLF